MYDGPDLISTTQVAALLAVSPRTVEAWRSRRVGPPFLRPSGTGLVRYSRAAVLAWVGAPKASASGEPSPLGPAS